MEKNKFLMFVLASVFLFSALMVSAQFPAELGEFLSENVTQIDVTITQETSEVDFYLDTLQLNDDFIELPEEFGGFDISAASLLNGIKVDLSIEEDSVVPVFDAFSIDNTNALMIFQYEEMYLIDYLLNYTNQDFRIDDINNNVTALNQILQENPLPQPSPAYSRFVKDGNNYIVSTEKGYGDIPTEYMDNIRDVINRSVHYVNVANIVDEALPFLEKEYNEELTDYQEELDLVKQFDLNYTVSAINTNSVKLRDGTYDVTVTFERGNESVEKVVHLTLEGIKNAEVVKVSNIYAPAVPEVSEFIDSLTGLQSDTSLVVEVFDSSPHATPTSIRKAFKFIDITVDKDTSARLYFKLNQTDVDDPGRVGLYVWESTHWTRLSTALLSTTNGVHKFEAEVPHFSSFMIAETEPPVTNDDDDDEKQSGGGGLPEPEEALVTSPPEPINLGEDEDEGFLSGITGAVIGFLGPGTGIVLVTVLAGVTVAMSAVRIRKKRLSKARGNIESSE